MNDPRTCQHEAFHGQFDIKRMADTGDILAEIQIRCTQCNTPFRFKGVPAGVHFEHPTVTITGEQLLAPIEPAVTPVLQTQATFTMPPRLKRN